MGKRKEICSTEGCGREVKSAGLCSACHSYFYYWLSKRSVAAIVKRKQDVAVYTARLNTLLGNVKTITGRRKKTG